jgi:hypothetical protein
MPKVTRTTDWVPTSTPNNLEYHQAFLDWVETTVVGHHHVTNNTMSNAVSFNVGHSKENASIFVKENNL